MAHAYLGHGPVSLPPSIICGKVPFADRKEAKKALNSMTGPHSFGRPTARGDGTKFDRYWCADCRAWHIGHRPPKKGKRR